MLWADPAGWAGSEADLLADEDDVDAAGQLLVDLQDLADLAVLPVGWPQPKQMTNSQRPDDQIAALPPNRRTVDGTWRQSEQGRATGDLGGSPVCDTEWKFGAAVHIEVQK